MLVNRNNSEIFGGFLIRWLFDRLNLSGVLVDRVYSCYMETEFSLFPRMAALAENVWSPAEKSLQDIVRKR